MKRNACINTNASSDPLHYATASVAPRVLAVSVTKAVANDGDNTRSNSAAVDHNPPLLDYLNALADDAKAADDEHQVEIEIEESGGVGDGGVH